MPHVDIELEDNKQFISNIPRIYEGPAKGFVTGSDYFSATFYQTYSYFYYKPSNLLVSVGDTDK